MRFLSVLSLTLFLGSFGCATADVDDVSEPFEFDLSIPKGTSPAVQSALLHGAEHWESVIERGLPDHSHVPADCGPSQGGFVDDVSVEIRFESLDGARGTLAVAGPTCIRRGAGFLPVTGRLTIDREDLERLAAEGTLEVVVRHELGHILGIGTGWGELSLLSGSSCEHECVEGADVRYHGTGARDAWLAMGGDGDVPVENRLGPGSQDSHWREDSPLRGELMSPVLSSTNPTSRVTLGALADLGFTVRQELPPESYALQAEALLAEGAELDLGFAGDTLPDAPRVLPD